MPTPADLGEFYVDGKKQQLPTAKFVDSLLDQTGFVTSARVGGVSQTQFFTSEKPFLAILEKQGALQGYKLAMARAAAARRQYASATPAETDKLRKLQAAKIEEDRRRISRTLKENGVDIHQIAQVAKLKDKFDPTRGPAFGSAWAFDGVRYTGKWVYLAPLWVYPNWSWFGFNDRAESAFALAGHGAVLFRHSWFRGSSMTIWNPLGPSGNAYFGWFSNRASSSSHW